MSYSVKGKSIKELSSLPIEEFATLNRAELSKVVSRLSSAANKRVKRMEAQEIESPAYRSYTESGGKFGAKNKTLNQLRAEYMRVSGFLKMRTSTVTGYKTFVKEFKKRVGMDVREEFPTAQIKEFYDYYHELVPDLKGLVKYENAQEYAFSVWSENKDLSIKELIEKAIEGLKTQSEELSAEDGTAKYFKVPEL